MILTIDVGNTNIVLGAYQEEKIQFVTRIATDARREADQYAAELMGIFQLYSIPPEEIDGVAMASVVPALTSTLQKALRHFTAAPPLVLSALHRGSITIAIDNPAELGTDIIASALAVRHSYPLPAVIIDMGTATKLTALDANGNLQGVSIAPGLFLSLNALVKGASLLQGISTEAPVNAIGKNTADSMKSGVVLGNAAMLDGMLDRFAGELGDIQSIVATGGAAQIVVPHCRHKITYSETLLLDGLYQAWQKYGK